MSASPSGLPAVCGLDQRQPRACDSDMRKAKEGLDKEAKASRWLWETWALDGLWDVLLSCMWGAQVSIFLLESSEAATDVAI